MLLQIAAMTSIPQPPDKNHTLLFVIGATIELSPLILVVSAFVSMVEPFLRLVDALANEGVRDKVDWLLSMMSR